MYKLALYNLTLSIVLLSSVVYSQKECRVMNSEKLTKLKPKIEDYHVVDTSDTGGYAYRCYCSNGNVILGNFNENGIAEGIWRVEMTNSKYVVTAKGEMREGRVDGEWSDSNWCYYIFEKGKFIKRICAKM